MKSFYPCFVLPGTLIGIFPGGIFWIPPGVFSFLEPSPLIPLVLSSQSFLPSLLTILFNFVRVSSIIKSLQNSRFKDALVALRTAAPWSCTRQPPSCDCCLGFFFFFRSVSACQTLSFSLSLVISTFQPPPLLHF